MQTSALNVSVKIIMQKVILHHGSQYNNLVGRAQILEKLVYLNAPQQMV